MPKLSLAMIVKDEEEMLSKCLDSVKEFVDEIILVDTGSKDRTKDISKKYTQKVYNFSWINDFAKARNFSLEKASGEWILVLDADEVIAKRDMKKILALIEKPEVDAYSLIQRNYTNDSTRKRWEPISDVPIYRESKDYKGYIKNPNTRLFRNKKGILFEGVVHAIVDPCLQRLGLKKEYTDIPIHHYYEEKKNNTLEQRQLSYLEVFEEKIKHNPTAELYYDAASVYLNFKKDYKKAIEYLEKAISYNYRVNECNEAVAQCYIGMKQYNRAYQIYRGLVKKNHITPGICNNLGNLFAMHGYYLQAIKFLKLALEKGNPNKERIEKNILALNELIEKKRKAD